MVSSEFQQCVQKCGDVAKYGYPYWNLCSAINPSKVHTHSSEHTHTPGAVGSHLRCGSPGAVGGSGALLKGTSVMVSKVERALYIHSPTYNLCRTWDSNPQPLGYESDSDH